MKALVTGITGQDGYYLSKLLLEKGYEVHGLIRRSSSFNTSRIEPLMSKYESVNKLKLYYSDLLDSSSITSLINLIEPDEVYNLAAQSHVAVSFKNPLYTSQVGTIGVISLLEAVKNTSKNIKFYQASSSEMYGGEDDSLLNEESPFTPKSPYAISKVFAHEMTKIYRDSYDMFAVNGILFNHESPHRGETFVTRKVTKAVGRIKQGIQTKLTLGNLNAFRDWGFAGDYVEAMWMMLQQKPDDFVIATGTTWSIRELLDNPRAVELFGEQELQKLLNTYSPTSAKGKKTKELDSTANNNKGLGDDADAGKDTNVPKSSLEKAQKMLLESFTPDNLEKFVDKLGADKLPANLPADYLPPRGSFYNQELYNNWKKTFGKYYTIDGVRKPYVAPTTGVDVSGGIADTDFGVA